jgi:hypothetical protein
LDRHHSLISRNSALVSFRERVSQSAVAPRGGDAPSPSSRNERTWSAPAASAISG